VNELTAEEAKAKFEAVIAESPTTGDSSKDAPPTEVKEPYYRFTTVTYSDTKSRIITALMPTDPLVQYGYRRNVGHTQFSLDWKV
jgi:hypothetical protein